MTIAVGQLLASGDLLDATEFCKRAGLSLDQLQAAVADGRWFYVEKDGLQGYPAFYFDAAVDRRVLESVCKFWARERGHEVAVLRHAARLARVAWQNGGRRTDRRRNPRTPLQALRDGEVELVTRAARGQVGR
jgi:hypothetical protein